MVSPLYVYDLAIIGGGPAGVAAGVYAARKKIKTILLTDSFGGQSLTSNDIQNWIGTKSLTGFDLAQNLEQHLRAQEDLEVKDGALVDSVEKSKVGFALKLKNGETVVAKYLLLANGSSRRKLGVPGEKELDGKGVAYCSTCDAPIFKDKIVAIVGGGNTGLEGVRDSIPYASKIYLLVRKDFLRGDQLTQEKIKTSNKVEIMFNTEVTEILGDKLVSGLKYRNNKTNETGELKTDGVFVEIGSIPNSGLVKDLHGVKLNALNEVTVDHKTQKAAEGIWAAGDITDVLYKQNNISAGDAVKAVLNIYDEMHGVKRN